MNVAKIIRASLGSTTDTLDHPTATLHPDVSTKSTFPYPTLKKPKARTPRSKAVTQAVSGSPVVAPAADTSGKHVEIVIKLLVPK